VAIFREKTEAAIELERKLFAGREPDRSERIADFSYQNDSLAEMIVLAWTDPTFRADLLHRQADGTAPKAKEALKQRGIYLTNPVVITEDEYFDGFHMQGTDGVIFVLPNQPRTEKPPRGQTLLETAKLLMACTPNGI
jgi:hypothetical protein